MKSTEIDVCFERVSLHAAREADLFRLLDGSERERAAAFRFAEDRTRFVTAHGVLREVLAANVGAHAASLRFARAPGGKPAVRDGGDLEFNLSHAGDLIAIAVGRDRAIGIDVEAPVAADVRAELADSVFTPAERKRFDALSEAAAGPAFLACWTRKEAYLKAIGRGIALGLTDVEVDFEPGAPPRLLSDRLAPDVDRWTVAALPVPAPYAGALVYSGPPATVRFAASGAGPRAPNGPGRASLSQVVIRDEPR